ncbi:MAG TPA: U32 family peptidase, partial [Lachnospiraceae bacterium]|nr:U32 family peptidase [Lachnospiraceae bacterium]
MRKIEILAPAGSYESLQAAINASCDAVYIGGNQFGARAYANNLNEDMLLQAIDYAHIHDKSLYLTINTLLKEQELNRDLYKYIVKYYERGLDAVIVQDPGVLHFIHRNFPDLPIHASTQMTLTMAEGANVLKEYGVTRIVTSRELSLEEVKNIRANTDLEIEAFVHGALCYCYSGQCLMSSMIGGRSGNRGRCAQPCRMPYDLYGSGKKLSNGQERHLLSPKDMCTLHLIPELIESGIDSFKIEGRMKRPEYTALASHLYRKYVDLYCKLGKEEYDRYLERNDREFRQDVMDLMDLYNRGSFTQGYYVSHNGKKMMSLSRPNHNGVLVGKVSSVKGNNATIQLVEDIHAQDILEIRISDTRGVNSTGSQVPNRNSKYTGKNSGNQRDSEKKYRIREERQVSRNSQTKDYAQDFDKSYEFTVKEEGRKGTTTRTNFFAKSKVAAGQEVYRTRNQALLMRLEEAFLKEERKVEITGHFSAKAGETMRLTLQYAHSRQTYTIHVTGDSPELAQNQSATSEQVMKQLRKTNATHFTFKALTIELDDGLFIPNGKLNDLRREAIE